MSKKREAEAATIEPEKIDPLKAMRQHTDELRAGEQEEVRDQAEFEANAWRRYVEVVSRLDNPQPHDADVLIEAASAFKVTPEGVESDAKLIRQARELIALRSRRDELAEARAIAQGEHRECGHRNSEWERDLFRKAQRAGAEISDANRVDAELRRLSESRPDLFAHLDAELQLPPEYVPVQPALRQFPPPASARVEDEEHLQAEREMRTADNDRLRIEAERKRDALLAEVNLTAGLYSRRGELQTEVEAARSKYEATLARVRNEVSAAYAELWRAKNRHERSTKARESLAELSKTWPTLFEGELAEFASPVPDDHHEAVTFADDMSGEIDMADAV